ncbi:MAG: amino acid ABC transporter substrate-binding protein [Burkholderiales bacterium]
MRRLLAVLLGMLALAASALAAPAWEGALSPRVARIKASGTVRLGYRDDVVPFSFVGRDGMPAGYSLDLCRAVVATLADELGVPLGIDYVRVTAQDRVRSVADGTVDLECGATTGTAQRRRAVAFSPVIFVTGTRLAVPRASKVRDVAALAGQRIAVVGGTTNEAALRDLDRRRSLHATLVVVDGYAAALAALADGRAEALAADEVLLRALLAESGRASEFRIVGPMLSLEPYGLMLPRDEPALAEAVAGTLRELAASREIVWLYDRWFTRPLPGGAAIGLPMGIELRRSFELLGLPPE